MTNFCPGFESVLEVTGFPNLAKKIKRTKTFKNRCVRSRNNELMTADNYLKTYLKELC